MYIKGITKSIVIILLTGLINYSCKNPGDYTDKLLLKEAYNICETNLILDTHIDWPSRLLKYPEDISEKTTKGDFDYERAQDGGLNAVFSVVWFKTSPDIDQNRIMVDSLIHLIKGYPKKYPDKFALAFTPDDIRRNYYNNLFSLPLCLEDGTPGLERNLSDTLIKAIAASGGIIMVNFGSFYLDPECFKDWTYPVLIWQDSTGIDLTSDEGIEFLQEYGKKHKLHSDSKKVVDHIEHIIDLVGIEYVGLGSDYDGIYSSQPIDLPDVSGYPMIVYELLKRGYSENDIKKILSENFLKVWNNVIEIADSFNNMRVI